MVRDNVEKKWMKNLQEVKQQQRTSQDILEILLKVQSQEFYCVKEY